MKYTEIEERYEQTIQRFEKTVLGPTPEMSFY